LERIKEISKSAEKMLLDLSQALQCQDPANDSRIEAAHAVFREWCLLEPGLVKLQDVLVSAGASEDTVNKLADLLRRFRSSDKMGPIRRASGGDSRPPPDYHLVEALRDVRTVCEEIAAQIPTWRTVAGKGKGRGERQTAGNSRGRGLWPKSRTEPEVREYWTLKKRLWNDLVTRSLNGDADAITKYKDTFGPTAIARAIGNGCKKQNIAVTDTYKEELQPPVDRKGPKQPKSWTPPKHNKSELDDTIERMREQSPGR
jgi:hypothetical protein